MVMLGGDVRRTGIGHGKAWCLEAVVSVEKLEARGRGGENIIHGCSRQERGVSRLPLRRAAALSFARLVRAIPRYR